MSNKGLLAFYLLSMFVLSGGRDAGNGGDLVRFRVFPTMRNVVTQLRGLEWGRELFKNNKLDFDSIERAINDETTKVVRGNDFNEDERAKGYRVKRLKNSKGNESFVLQLARSYWQNVILNKSSIDMGKEVFAMYSDAVNSSIPKDSYESRWSELYNCIPAYQLASNNLHLESLSLGKEIGETRYAKIAKLLNLNRAVSLQLMTELDVVVKCYNEAIHLSYANQSCLREAYAGYVRQFSNYKLPGYRVSSGSFQNVKTFDEYVFLFELSNRLEFNCPINVDRQQRQFMTMEDFSYNVVMGTIK